MVNLVVFFAFACPGQTEGASRQSLPLEKIDDVLEQSVLITGLARSFDTRWGCVVVYGKGKNQMAFCVYTWPDKVKKANEAAQREDCDLWVTMRVVIRVNPKWRADGKYLPPEPPYIDSGVRDTDKYYFSDRAVVKTEARKRKVDGSHATPPEEPIQKDNKR